MKPLSISLLAVDFNFSPCTIVCCCSFFLKLHYSVNPVKYLYLFLSILLYLFVYYCLHVTILLYQRHFVTPTKAIYRFSFHHPFLYDYFMCYYCFISYWPFFLLKTSLFSVFWLQVIFYNLQYNFVSIFKASDRNANGQLASINILIFTSLRCTLFYICTIIVV